MRTSLLTTGLFVLLLPAAVAASIWAVFLSGSPARVLSSEPEDTADASMEQVSATIFNADGIASMHIESPKMLHYPKDDTTLIQRPVVTLYRKSAGPWHVSADKGSASHGIDKIFLEKNVIVHHRANPLDPEMTLTTETLSVFPELAEASTRDAVTISQPNATIRAVGMNANFTTGVVHLLSDTRSDYVPAS